MDRTISHQVFKPPFSELPMRSQEIQWKSMDHRIIGYTEADMVVAEVVARDVVNTNQDCYLQSISPNIIVDRDLPTTINHTSDTTVVSHQCPRPSINHMHSKIQSGLQH